MKLFRKQCGFFWIPAAIAAAATIASARSAARSNRLAQQNANDQIAQNEAWQREYAQNAIRWRVADAKAAGLHPLFALSGGTAGYQPSPISVLNDTSQATAIQNFGSIASRFASDYMNQGGGSSGELYGPPDSAFSEEPVTQSYAVSPYGGEIASSLPAQYTAPVSYGMASNLEKPAMAYWAIPGIGRVIAPDASNFSESIEGLESEIGQALILYLNRQLGPMALDYLSQQMPGGLSFSRRVDRLSKSPYWSDPVGAGYADIGRWLDSFRR